MTITLVMTCLAILAASVLGGIVPLATVLNHTRLQVYLSFSAGTMLGAAFFHMLPEAVRVGSASTIPWAAAGLLALFFLERFFSFHHHEPRKDELPIPTSTPGTTITRRARQTFTDHPEQPHLAIRPFRQGMPFLGARRPLG